MTPKEAIIEAFELRSAGKVPATVFGGGVWTIRRWGKQFGEMVADPQAYADLIIKTNEELRSPIVYVGSGYNNYLAAAIGGKIKERPLGAPDLETHLVKETADEVVGIDPAVIENDQTIRNIREAARLVAKAIGDQVAVTVTAWGPFTLAGQIYGVEPMMKAALKKKDEVHKMMEFATKLVKQFYKPLVEDKVIPLLAISDPTGSGDLISERMFRAFSLPHLKPLIGWAKEYGVHTWLHICGNTTDKLEAIAETGASCFSLDYKVDLKVAKQRVGGKIALAGNVDPVSILNQKGPDDVRASSQACIEAAAEGGGFILTSGCDLPPTISIDNIRAMLDMAKS